jgi:H+/gluconate symporter-like permease
MMGGTLTAGILVGYAFVVPGLGTVAIAGLLDVPLGTMLVFGTLIGPPTAVLTTFIYGRLLRYGLWNEAKDESHLEEMHEESPSVAEDVRNGAPTETEQRGTAAHRPPLCTSRCCQSRSRCS